MLALRTALVVGVGCASAAQPGIEIRGSEIEPYLAATRACVEGPPWHGKNRENAPLALGSPFVESSGNGKKLLVRYWVEGNAANPHGVDVVLDVASKHCDRVIAD